MKIKYFSLCLLILSGCAVAININQSGRDFDETKVSQIKKSVTKADDIVALYGEPDTKEIVSPTQVMWHYTYLNTKHQTHSSPFGPLTETTTGYKKNLDVLLQDDVVVNFTYVKVPIQTEKQSSGGVWSN